MPKIIQVVLAIILGVFLGLVSNFILNLALTINIVWPSIVLSIVRVSALPLIVIWIFVSYKLVTGQWGPFKNGGFGENNRFIRPEDQMNIFDLQSYKELLKKELKDIVDGIKTSI